MIDIHAHILPGVDDGAQNVGESLHMLRDGIADGIRGVVCTSHVLDRLDKSTEKRFVDAFHLLRTRVKDEGLAISLWLGSELHTQSEFNMRSPVATFNANGKYALLELPMGHVPRDAEDRFFQLSVNGVTPILAHPERNIILMQRPGVTYNLVHRGVLLQVNAGSLTGRFGKRVKQAAFEMIDLRWVHFVASDCHSPAGRSMKLGHARDIVTKRWGDETAVRLFETNPLKAVQGETIVPPEPLPPRKGGLRSGLLGKIFRSA